MARKTELARRYGIPLTQCSLIRTCRDCKISFHGTSLKPGDGSVSRGKDAATSLFSILWATSARVHAQGGGANRPDHRSTLALEERRTCLGMLWSGSSHF